MNNQTITKEILINEWINNRLSQKEIADKYNVSLGVIEYKIKANNLNNLRDKLKYEVNEQHISLESPVFWYLLGLVISDGYIDNKNNRISITLTDDYDILETLSKFYSKNKAIPIYKYATSNKNKFSYRLSITSSSLISLFKSLNIDGNNKTENVYLPDPNSKYLFNFLLRGFIDGDGSIRYFGNCKRIEFRAYIHSNDLVESLKTLYKKYYLKDVTVYNVKGKAGKHINTSQDSFDELLEIYNDIPELALQRKRNIIKNKVDDIVHLYKMINCKNW